MYNSKIQNPVVVALLALLCCALWGSATPFIKTGYKIMFTDGMPDIPSSILFAGIRFLLAGVFTIIFYSLVKRKFVYPKKDNLRFVGLIAMFQTVIQYFFFYIGLANTSGTKGAIISGSSTFFAIIISALIFKQEKLTFKKILACVIGFSGILIINLNGLEFSMNLSGDCFVLFSTIASAVSSVLIKMFSTKENPIIISGYQFAFGGLIMILSGLCFGGEVNLSSLKGILIIIYLAFLSAVAYGIWSVLLKYNPVSKVTVFTFTIPLFGVLLTHIMLPHEEANVTLLSLIIALIAVCAGVLMLNFEKPVHKSKNSG